ncbi:hypothetical protein [Ferrimonas lipolytica]|uniref:Lipoprotein n=1 Tax=Ferrimonas lipolytica TaxID=2724191 RepID=A0A6H1UCA7_9GAMM|nr:hypothetical protein [Ferrimonas lipolytica]QIZ76691.1 hypothetical protein HER31_07285 [Ferrimonas lipolytica]
MRVWALPLLMVTLTGCEQIDIALERYSNPAGLSGCAQPNDIVSVEAIANNANYVIYELDYCYDGSFGENVRINLAPANKENFLPHAPIQAIVGRNQVAITLVSQNFKVDTASIPLTHLEISLDLIGIDQDQTPSRKLLSQVLPLTAELRHATASTKSS